MLYMHLFFFVLFFIFNQISNCLWYDMLISEKKNLWKKTKKPLKISFNFLTFNGILIVSLYFLFLFYFFIFDQIWNYVLSYMIITKTNHFESIKLPLNKNKPFWKYQITAGIENFSFKSISVFSLCFIKEKIHNSHVYIWMLYTWLFFFVLFFIFNQISNCLWYDMSI